MWREEELENMSTMKMYMEKTRSGTESGERTTDKICTSTFTYYFILFIYSGNSYIEFGVR